MVQIDAIAASRLLHRDPGTYAHFLYDPLSGSSIASVGLKPPDEPTECGFLKVDRLSDPVIWRDLKRYFDHDLYFSLNGFRSPASAEAEGTWRLNAVWIDCDCDEIEPEDALKQVGDLVPRGLIPSPSVTIQSGNGVWALWLLRGASDDPQLPPEARLRNRLRQKRLNETIGRVVMREHPDLGWDKGSVDAARHIRIAGSWNGSAKARVVWEGPTDPARYTLDELEAFMWLPALVRRQPSSGTPSTRPAARRKASDRARFERYLGEFWKVVYHRGRVREGDPSRNGAANLLGYLLAMLGWSRAEVEREVRDFGKEWCRPRLTAAEARAQSKSSYKYAMRVRNPGKSAKPMTNRSMAARLGVSIQEADQLGLEKLRPDYCYVRPHKVGRDELAEKRRQVIADLAGPDGVVRPSLRATRDRLVSLGHRISVQGVVNDLRRLGLRTTAQAPPA